MNSRFLASLSGAVLAAAGIGIANSTASPAHASPVKFPTQASSFELAGKASGSPMVKDDQKVEDEQNEQIDEEAIKSLPEALTDAIFKNVSKETGIEASKLRIVKVERESWSDGCLGLGGADTLCSQSIVPGWRVIVASGEKLWVYRTNQSGSVVKLDEVASRTLTASETTTQITCREVTTLTTQTTQSVSGTASSESRSSESTQASAGSAQISGAASSESRSSESTQASAGSAQISGAASSRTQQQAAVMRSSRAQVSFADIAQSYWAKDFIAELAMRGIFTGFPDGKFHPNEPVTRAQFAALVSSVFKMKTKVRDAINFKDVSSSHWAYEKIREAYEMGFLDTVSGNDFKPEQSLTRLQIMTALAKGLNYKASNIEKALQFYSDAAAIPTNARSLVAAATERGIVANYPNVKTCEPNQEASRAEVAAFLHQAMVSNGDAIAISSPYVAGTQAAATQAGQGSQAERVKPGKPARQHCNQGIGNGAEGCDPGNSHPHGGSNDETGRTPGSRSKK